MFLRQYDRDAVSPEMLNASMVAAEETGERATSWRIRLHKVAAACVRRLGHTSVGLALVKGLRALPLVGGGLSRALVGYYRPFASLRDATDAVARFSNNGHQNVANVIQHLELAVSARPSDYAALFHIRPMLPGIRRIFDLGGNVGNLFYCYCQYLDLPPEITWQVRDLPCNIARGRAMADARGARQLHFSDKWTDASGADLLIASGSLHYFERPLPQMIADLPVKPLHVLINRTPLTGGAPVATVQEVGEFRVACMLYNRSELIRDFTRVGYVLVDAWQAAALIAESPVTLNIASGITPGFVLFSGRHR